MAASNTASRSQVRLDLAQHVVAEIPMLAQSVDRATEQAGWGGSSNLSTQYARDVKIYVTKASVE